jgi:hypothetical protein
VPWIGGEGDKDKTIELKSGFALPHDKDVGAVICGFDRFINYYKIQYAQVGTKTLRKTVEGPPWAQFTESIISA